MSQRSTSPLKRSTVRRTLQRFWDVTRTQPLIVFLSVFSSSGYIFLLTFANTYVMALIVDRVQAGPVAGDQVFEVFGPYILALVLVNLVGQILSKLQDYTVYTLEIAGNYHLARLCFDTLSNQSMTFHTSRFGGSLVSQTSRFMSGYTGLVDVTVYSLIPTITSVICTVAALAGGAHIYRDPGGHHGRLHCVCLAYVQAHHAAFGRDVRRAEQAVGRAVRRGHEHPGRQDLWARGL